MTRKECKELLTKCASLATGESVGFTHELHSLWKFNLTREENKYSPSLFRLEGDGGEYGTIGRRYCTAEAALLHVVNGLNENKAIKNRYTTLEEWLGEDRE